MEILEIGSRGWKVTFNTMEEWIVNIYVCFAKNNTYLVDTFCGPDSMDAIKEMTGLRAGNKPLIVVNTHYHWDHVWGNCSFPESTVIAHRKCRDLLEQEWENQIRDNQSCQLGVVKKRLPTLLIEDQWTDIEDEVEIFHTPGHTEDGISFYDHRDGVLFVGDNVEYPLPYVESAAIDQYILTLKSYLLKKFDHLVSSHSEYSDKDLILSNINYLEKLKNAVPQHFLDPYANKVHQLNLDFLKSHMKGNPTSGS